MFLLPPSSYSSYFLPLRFVDDWKFMAPLFFRELEAGVHMTVHRVGDTFLVIDPAPGDRDVNFAHPNRPLMFWLLLVLGDTQPTNSPGFAFPAVTHTYIEWSRARLQE